MMEAFILLLPLLLDRSLGSPAWEEGRPEHACENGRFYCVEHNRCHSSDIVSRSVGIIGQQWEDITHPDCPGDHLVCCTEPLYSSLEEPFVPECGRRNQDGLGLRIATGIGDGKAKFGEFPWMAIVLRAEEVHGMEKLVFVSAGSLVHPQAILTAAHSVESLKDSVLLVRLGEWDVESDFERIQYIEMYVNVIEIHPHFDSDSLYDDVALLILDQPVELHPHIDTLCLPSHNDDYNRSLCVTCGWGKQSTDNGTFQSTIRSVELPFIPRDTCEDMLRTNTLLGPFFHLDSSFVCAGGFEGEDACNGDGGAPLACPDPHQPDRWVQVGVVSWGIDCGEADVPGVYADVRPHVDWILETIERLASTTNAMAPTHEDRAIAEYEPEGDWVADH